jgi:hypothetical protein
MNMAAYASATGATVDNKHFTDQFRGYFDMLVVGETQLLDIYRSTLAGLGSGAIEGDSE